MWRHVWVGVLVTAIWCQISEVRGQDLGMDTCDVTRRPVEVQADAVAWISTLIGFSYPSETDGFGCGSPATSGMEAYEAMKWTLGLLNQDSGSINGVTITQSYVPGIKIGLYVEDTCQREDIAYRAVMGLFPTMYSREDVCYEIPSKLSLGVIGASTSGVTAPLASVLGTQQITQITYSSTAPSLSDTNLYPYLIRTVPTDQIQIQVILEVAKQLEWTYIAVVYTDDTYGLEGYQILRDSAPKKDICITSAIPVSATTTDPTVLRDVMNQLLQTDVTGVVFFGTQLVAAGLISVGLTVSGAGRFQWIFPDSVGTTSNILESYKYARGIISISPAIRHISEFENHWVSIDEQYPVTDNPWFREWYMTANKCKLPGSNTEPYDGYPDCILQTEAEKHASYIQNQYVEPAISAIYTYAKALKTAQAAICGFGYTGVCDGLANLTPRQFFENYIEYMDFTFTNSERIPSLASNNVPPYYAAKRIQYSENGDLKNPAFDVWNYNDASDNTFKFNKVGTYINGELTFAVDDVMFYDIARLVELNPQPVSTCGDDGCAICLTGQSDGVQYAYTDGDIVIGGLFSVHKKGVSDYTCGEIDSSEGAQLAEAFLFAISKIPLLGILPNIQVGSLIIDDCSSAQIGTSTLTNFLSSSTTFTYDGILEVDPAKVHGYSASSDDVMTLGVAEIMTSFKIPQVGYKATTTQLSDQEVYPYFARTVPSDRKLVSAIISLLAKFSWTKIQLAREMGEFGDAFEELLTSSAVEFDICISSSYEVNENSNFTTLASQLTATGQPKVVIVNIAQGSYIDFLPAIQSDTHVVIAVGAFSTMNDLQSILATLTYGLLAFELEAPYLQSYQNFLQTLKPQTATNNPWFNEWYEASLNCYIDPNSPNGYTQQCNNVAVVAITSALGFEQNTYSNHVINSVLSIAYGIHETLQSYCGTNYNSICSDYRNSASRPGMVMEKIRQVAFRDESGQTFQMNDEGGVAGYNLMYEQQGQMIKVGEYDVVEDSLDVTVVLLNSIRYTISRCEEGSLCSECAYLYPRQPYIFIPGDVVVAGIFNIHDREAGSDFRCGELRVDDGYLYTEAFQFAIENINSGGGPVSLTGLQVGALVLDACNSSLRAANQVGSIYSGALAIPGLDTNTILGWTAADDTLSIDVNNVLKQMGTPFVSSSATTTGPADTEFYRAVPLDTKLVEGLLKLLDYLGWNYVNVVYSADVYGRNLRDLFVAESAASEVCVLDSIEMYTDGTASQIALALLASPTSTNLVFAQSDDVTALMKGLAELGTAAQALTVITTNPWTPPSSGAENLDGTLSFIINTPAIIAFDNYMTAKAAGNSYTASNPWFDEYYENLFQCDLGPVDNYGRECVNPTTNVVTMASNYDQGTNVVTTVNALYALVDNYHDVIAEFVCGPNYNLSTCTAYDNFDAPQVASASMLTLPLVSFQDPTGMAFQFVDKAHDRPYVLQRFASNTGFDEAATYSSGSLRLTMTDLASQYVDTVSACGSDCDQCEAATDSQEPFAYIPGDVYLAGLFDIHENGGDVFSCGSINSQEGVHLLEAFSFAIDYINNNQGIFANKLSGVTLGGLGLDTCESATRASTLVANVQSGVTKLEYDNDVIDPASILAYIGGSRDDVTKGVADMLSVLEIPQISFGATSVLVSNAEYPYFMRTVANDKKQAIALVSLLAQYNIEYIQVISSEGFGYVAAQEFIQIAERNGVCIAQNITVDSSSTLTLSSAQSAVAELFRKPLATVIVNFIDTDDINIFLRAIDNTLGAEDFKFIGSLSWSENEAILSTVEDRVVGSVTVALEQANIDQLDTYLVDKFPSTYTQNPWFGEWYESIFQCSIDPDSLVYTEQCDDTTIPVVDAVGYKQDPNTLHVINAVFSAALALHGNLESLCGISYDGLCDAFLVIGEKRSLLRDALADVTFMDLSNRQFEFTAEGDGNRGFFFWEIEKAGDTYYYDLVGFYDSRLLMEGSLSLSWDAGCGGADVCGECPDVGSSITRYMQLQSSENLNIVGFFDVHHADPSDNIVCGDLDPAEGFQNVLAFFYAIEKINANENLQTPSDLTLGGLAIDTCSNTMRTSADIFSLTIGDGLSGVSPADLVDPTTVLLYMPMGDDNTAAVTELVSARDVITLSPDSTSAELDGTPFLLRTSPSTASLARTLVEIAATFNWPYVTVVHTDDAYGTRLKDAVMGVVDDVDVNTPVCVATIRNVTSDAGVTQAILLVQELDAVAGANVVMLLTNEEVTRNILQATSALGLGDRFVWIASPEWGTKSEIAYGLDWVARGAITVTEWGVTSSGFIDYVTKLNVADHGNIPDDWFEEFWQRTLECKLLNSSAPMSGYYRTCRDNEYITASMMEQHPSAIKTIISTYMTANSLLDLDQCSSSPLGLAGCLSQLPDRNSVLYESLRSTEWDVLASEMNDTFKFRFTDTAYGYIGYNIYNYQRMPSGQYQYVQIGTRFSQMDIDVDMYESYKSDGTPSEETPASECPGTACICVNPGGAVNNAVDGAATGGVGVDDNFFKTWGIIVAALTVIGIITTSCALIYLCISYPNRSGTTYVGYLLLFGVLCMYALVLAFIFNPTDAVCSARRFGLGFVYVVCFSCMLIKVMNNWRVETYAEDFEPATYDRIAHPCSMLFIAIFLTLVQVVIAAEWLVLKPSKTELMFYDSQYNPVCSPSDFYYEELIISCIYPMLLMLVTLAYSALTWDSGENHRESRWILFTSCASIGVWLIWTVVATMTDTGYKDAAVAIALLVNATLILLCIFIRKVYLLVKYQRHIEDERRSQFSGSAFHDITDQSMKTEPVIFYDNGTMRSHVSHLSHVSPAYDPSTLPREGYIEDGIMYIYDAPPPPGADIEF